MPRLARTVAIGVLSHITKRSNHKQDVFFSSEDRLVYPQWLAEYAAKYNSGAKSVYATVESSISLAGSFVARLVLFRLVG